MKRTYRWPPLLLCAVLSVLVLSCAKRGSPPGGPADTTVPYVDEVIPPSGSVRVGADSLMSVEFSETMKKRTVETGIIVSPPSRWKKRYWKKNTYYLIPETGLKPNTTYLISVSNKVKDSHDVAMKSTFISGFSTGDSINAGIITGAIKWKNVTVEAAVVELFDIGDYDTSGVVRPGDPLYVTLSGAGGLYEIPFVDTGKRYRLQAFLDKDVNSEYDDGEAVGCYNGDVVFEGVSELDSVDFTICGNTLSGAIRGLIDTASVADTLTITVLAESVTDSSVTYWAAPKKSGEFEIKCVTPGAYLIQAFSDVNVNHEKDPGDTFFVEVADTLSVESCSKPREVRFGFGEDD
ncbi:MAG: Ig-like domain-containing protein [Candidatus Eisenbacteria bacterium]